MSNRRTVTRTCLVATGAVALVLPLSVSASAAQAAPTKGTSPVTVEFSPGTKARFGVGQLVTVRFSQPISRKAEVEKAITLTSTTDLPEGSWGWVDDSTAVYRPRKFWPANARITFKAALADVVLGKADGRSLVAPDSRYVFKTGRSFVMKVRDSKHAMTVSVDGEVAKTMPVSLGKAGWATRSGVKILTADKGREVRMTGYDPGVGERWDVIAPFAMRLTPSGEYIHGAPWANARIGRYNGSHGCTNMFVKDAKWLFNHSRPGDPVITKGTGRPMTTDNGVPGAYWNYTWQEWLQKSAINGSPALAQSTTTPDPGPPAGP